MILILRLMVIAVLIQIIVGCSSTSFRSQGKANISQSMQKKYTTTEEIIIRKEFYLWGLLPQEQNIEVDTLLLTQNHFRESDVTISKYRTSRDMMLSLITFGFFSPVHYKLEYRGEKFEDEGI